MPEVRLHEESGKNSEFILVDNGSRIGSMSVRITGNELIAFHTEVDPAQEGKGFAKFLLGAMVDHARKNKLKVVPLCPYVHAQFKRHEKEYGDLWEGREK